MDQQEAATSNSANDAAAAQGGAEINIYIYIYTYIYIYIYAYIYIYICISNMSKAYEFSTNNLSTLHARDGYVFTSAVSLSRQCYRYSCVFIFTTETQRGILTSLRHKGLDREQDWRWKRGRATASDVFRPGASSFRPAYSRLLTSPSGEMGPDSRPLNVSRASLG